MCFSASRFPISIPLILATGIPGSNSISYQVFLINVPSPGHWPHSSGLFLPPSGLAVLQGWFIPVHSARNRDLGGHRLDLEEAFFADAFPHQGRSVTWLVFVVFFLYLYVGVVFPFYCINTKYSLFLLPSDSVWRECQQPKTLRVCKDRKSRLRQAKA